jgi:hypothetical protein
MNRRFQLKMAAERRAIKAELDEAATWYRFSEASARLFGTSTKARELGVPKELLQAENLRLDIKRKLKELAK